ncbi:hypothetical protein CF319_g5936 [Tilletia indica]|nr:hypothetical protein CF319_g5936 [Tilletia indica]KAE8234080.1 hypothetical protein CF326_g876 [Tilletia indica]
MATPETPRWLPTLIPGLPEELLPSGHAIEGAYLNSGRMSEGLAGLQSSTLLLQQASDKSNAATEHVRKNVSRLLGTMHRDVKDLLVSMQERMDDEMDGIRSRVRKQQSSTLEAVDRHIQVSVSAVEDILQDAGSEARNEFLSALNFLKDCGTKLQRDVNTTERGYMRTLAQLIISNSWTSTWPAAVRTFHQVNGDTQGNPPPQYAMNAGMRRPGEGPVEAANGQQMVDPTDESGPNIGTTVV